MRLCEMLVAQRILVDTAGDVRGKEDALRKLAAYIAPIVGSEASTLEQALGERERLQSTAIGDGVAIPHTFVESAGTQAAALLLCPRGIPFDSIDGADVNIVFGVVGPKRDTGAHLRALARISRLLRDADVRRRLVESPDAESVYRLIEQHEADLR